MLFIALAMHFNSSSLPRVSWRKSDETKHAIKPAERRPSSAATARGELTISETTAADTRQQAIINRLPSISLEAGCEILRAN